MLQAQPCIEPALLVTQARPRMVPSAGPTGTAHSKASAHLGERDSADFSQHLTEGRQDTWDGTRLRNVFPPGFVVKIHIFFFFFF